MLLSDPEVQKVLQERYVLCWQSIRPVPKVTIDFGNGQVMERTLKGNTVFYLCRPDGRVLDAFPGVYTPRDFLTQLNRSDELAKRSDRQVVGWHQQLSPGEVAAESKELMPGKMVVESPLLRSLEVKPGSPPAVGGSSPYRSYVATLKDLSHDPMTREEAAVRAPGSGVQVVEEDSRRNVTAVRPAVHLLLGTCYGVKLPLPEECRMALFKEILGVPLDDPYLGLGQPGIPGTP